MQIVRSGRPAAAAAAAAGRKREGKAGSGEILVAECLGSAQRASSRQADDDAGKRWATSYEAEPRRLPVPAQEKQTRRGSRVVAAPHAVPCCDGDGMALGGCMGVWVKPASNVSFAGHDAEGGVGSASSGALGASCLAARFCARSFSPRLRLGQRIITTTPKPRDVRDAAAGAAVKKCTQHVSVAARSHAA